MSLHDDPLLRNVPEVKGYKVLRPAVLYAKIGQGGMGAVYRGRHLNLEVDVAVKCLKSSLVDEDPRFIARFQREAKLAAGIHHENLIHVYDVASESGVHYLVMEFIAGETVRQRVQRKGPLSERESLTIALGAARGLAVAHRKKIVHRDIKPDNILVSRDGAVKVADLGIARAVDSEEFQTLTHGSIGTPQYMPPEQWIDASKVSTAADVWSLGATLYFLLVGDNAIRANTQGECALRICNQDFPDISKVVPSIDPRVRALLRRMTERDPTRRQQDASEVAREIEGLLGAERTELHDEDSGTGPITPTLVSPPPARTLAEIRIEISTQANASVADKIKPAAKDLDATLPITEPAAQPKSAPKPAAQPKRRSRVPLIAGIAVLALGGAFAAWKLGPGGTGRPGEADPVPPPVAKATIELADPTWLETSVVTSSTSFEISGVVREAKSEALRITCGGDAKDYQLERSGAFRVSQALKRDATNLVTIEHADAPRVTLKIEQDSRPPVLTIDSPAPRARTRERSIALAGRVSDAHLDLVRTGTTKARVADGKWTLDAVALAKEGSNEILVEAFDDAGLQSEQAIQVELDLTAPRILDHSASGGTVPPGRPLKLRVEFDEPVESLTFGGKTTAPRSKSVEVPIDVPNKQGRFPVALEVGDELKNVEVRSLTLEAGPVRQFPRVVLDRAPAAGAIYTKSSTLELSGRVENFDSGPLRVTVNGKRIDYPIEGGGKFVANVALVANATNAVVLSHSDAKTIELTLVHDSQPPRVQLVEPAADALATRASIVDLLVEATDDNLESVKLGSTALASIGRDRWRASGVKLGSDGAHDFTIVATDRVGNAASVEVHMRRDTRGPNLVSSDPASGTEVLPGDDIELRLRFDEPVGRLLAGGNRATFEGAEGRLRVSITEGEGDFQLDLQAFDALDNSARASLSFRRKRLAPLVDPKPPVVVPTPPEPEPEPTPAPDATPAWAVLVARDPDPAVVTDAAIRGAIADTKLPWKVKDKATGMVMVLVPPGRFVQNDGAHRRDVTISRAFYCGIYEVQESEWATVMASPGKPGRPKSEVSHVEAQEFFARVNTKSPGAPPMRFLWEAEWEYACRAGSTAERYGEAKAIAVYGKDPLSSSASSVGTKRANGFGLFDTLGNLYEWCGDWFEETARRAGGNAPATDPRGPASSKLGRVMRGGCFGLGVEKCTAGEREYDAADVSHDFYGLRAAREP